MRTYGQYCPIARAAEILAERWTPIILRNLLLGATTFGQIADGAPGISRTLLTYRLKELEQVGVIATSPNPNGRGSLYALTKAGNDLNGVCWRWGAGESAGSSWVRRTSIRAWSSIPGAAGISPASTAAIPRRGAV